MIEWIGYYFLINFILTIILIAYAVKIKDKDYEKNKYFYLIMMWLFGLLLMIFFIPLSLGEWLAKLSNKKTKKGKKK